MTQFFFMCLKKAAGYARKGFLAGATLGYIVSNDCTQEQLDADTCDFNALELMGRYSLIGAAAGYIYGSLLKDKKNESEIHPDFNLRLLQPVYPVKDRSRFDIKIIEFTIEF